MQSFLLMQINPAEGVSQAKLRMRRTKERKIKSKVQAKMNRTEQKAKQQMPTSNGISKAVPSLAEPTRSLCRATPTSTWALQRSHTSGSPCPTVP
eukprot:gene7249-5097_t